MINPDEHVLEEVDAYLHGVLSPQDDRQIAAHCESCPICRVALEEARKRQEALQSLPPVEAPEALIRQTLQRIERHQVVRRNWTRYGLTAAAAAVLALAAVHLYFYNMAPSP